MLLKEMETPALLLDKGKLDNNIAKMNDIVARHKVKLRPHLKTCKSLEVANRIFETPANASITVSTLAEAEYFLKGGYTDILYAVSITANKLRRIKALQEKGAVITVILDTLEAALILNDTAASLNMIVPVLIEVDSDGKRAGLKQNDAKLISIGQQLNQAANTELAGVMTHAGGSYYCKSIAELEAFAEQERKAITDAAKSLKDNNLPCPIVSLGSTPTVTYAKSLSGVTEVRAGVYVFQDLVMQALNVCDKPDVAISVLATVISHNVPHNRVLIDAGSLALSEDPGKLNEFGKTHFGQVCNAESQAPYPGLYVNSTNQEHGLIMLEGTDYSFSDFPIGMQLRILPNHACITAAAYSEYMVTDNDGNLIDQWGRCNGW